LLPHQEHFINPFIISGISQILFLNYFGSDGNRQHVIIYVSGKIKNTFIYSFTAIGLFMFIYKFETFLLAAICLDNRLKNKVNLEKKFIYHFNIT